MIRQNGRDTLDKIPNDISKILGIWRDLLDRSDHLGMCARSFSAAQREPTQLLKQISEGNGVSRTTAIHRGCRDEEELACDVMRTFPSLERIKEVDPATYQHLVARALCTLLQIELYTGRAHIHVEALRALPLPFSPAFEGYEFRQQQRVARAIQEDVDLMAFINAPELPLAIAETPSPSQVTDMQRLRFHMWQRVTKAVFESYDMSTPPDSVTSALVHPVALYDRLLSVGLESHPDGKDGSGEAQAASIGSAPSSLLRAGLAFAKIRANAFLINKVVSILSTDTTAALAADEFTAQFGNDLFVLMAHSVSDVGPLMRQLHMVSSDGGPREQLQLFAHRSFAVPFERQFVTGVLTCMREDNGAPVQVTR